MRCDAVAFWPILEAVEHILEVSFKATDGFEKAAEVFLRYSCHGTSCVADVPLRPVDFNATHVFALSASDTLSSLFEGRDHALTIQAWIALTKGELRRPLAVAVLPASDVRDFLKASMASKPRPEALLGSQKKWTLDFSPLPTDPKLKKPPEAAVTGTLELILHHRRRPVQDPQRIPLPWSSSFAGRLVVCRKGVATAGLNDPEEAPSGLAPREEAPPPKPPPGSVIIQVGHGMTGWYKAAESTCIWEWRFRDMIIFWGSQPGDSARSHFLGWCCKQMLYVAWWRDVCRASCWRLQDRWVALPARLHSSSCGCVSSPTRPPCSWLVAVDGPKALWSRCPKCFYFHPKEMPRLGKAVMTLGDTGSR